MDEKEKQILEHTLGLNYATVPFRNYFCTGTDTADYPIIARLVESGMMASGRAINDGDMRYYHVTKQGAEALGTTLPLND